MTSEEIKPTNVIKLDEQNEETEQPNQEQEKEYELIESEVYKIIIE